MASSSFEKAFASARKAGKKEFTWNGKQYNTELKETIRPKARSISDKVQRPMARPVQTAAKVTSGRNSLIPSMSAIRAGNEAESAKRDVAREARRDAREARRKAREKARRAGASSTGRSHIGSRRPLGT